MSRASTPAQEERIPDEDDTTEAPLTMAASVVLTNLPRDASKALENAGDLAVQKSTYSFYTFPRLSPLQMSNQTPTLFLHPRIFQITSTPPLSINNPANHNHSNRPSPTHRLRPTALAARLQSQHQAVFRQHRAFPAPAAGRERARERVLLCW